MIRERTIQPRSCSGFTLVELLVVVAILAVLVALSFVVLQRSRIAGSAATMTNNFRQIGTAIVSYAQDHNDYMPGPLHFGQRSIYRTSPPTHLAYHLRDYLAAGDTLEERELIPQLSSPMWRRMTPTEGGISMFSQQDVDPDPRVRRNPWGYAGADREDPNASPIKMARLFSYGRLPWALVEADQAHPDLGSPGWKAQMAEKPVHGSYRLALRFDGSVVRLPLDDESGNGR